MEVTALWIRQCLLSGVLVLLPAQVQHSYSHKPGTTYPRIVPSKLQLFEYESVFINCEGFFNDLIEWRVMRRIRGADTTCNNKGQITGPCTITTAYSMDNGEYWCEADGKKSNRVKITVAAGMVVLESPALPVLEGEYVILLCRNKNTSRFKADFYKDSIIVGSSFTGEMIIHSVSKLDEGLYKCKVSGGGESAESWLAVTAGSVTLESPALPVLEGDAVTLLCRNKKTSKLQSDFYKNGLLFIRSLTGEMILPSISKSDEGLYKCEISGAGQSAESWLAVRAHRDDSRSPHVIILWMVVSVLLVALLLLLMVGLHYTKHRVSAEVSARDLHLDAVDPRKKKGASDNFSFAFSISDKNHTLNPEAETAGAVALSSAATPVLSTSPNPLPTEEEHFYYTID